MKAFVTKYALTSGILEVEAAVCDKVDSDTIKARAYPYVLPTYFHKGDWFITREDAVAKAKKMRLNKIKSLKKQIEKLEKLKF